MAITDARIDLGTIAVLHALAAAGSISRAAEQLGVSQQAVSARVRAAERRIGHPLVRRGSGGSVLTDAGRLVVEWSEPVLRAADRLEDAITTLGGPERALVVAASRTVAEQYLPAWLAAMRAARADRDDRAPVTLRLRSGNSSEVQAAVRDGSADVGFVETPDVSEDLQRTVVGADPLAVVVAPDHPWADRVVGRDALASTSLVVREPGSGTRAAFERWMATGSAVDVTLPEPASVLDTTAAIRAAVAAGVAPAVLSARAVREDVAAGRIVLARLDDDPPTRDLTAVWRGALSAAGSRLVRVAAADGGGAGSGAGGSGGGADGIGAGGIGAGGIGAGGIGAGG